MTADLTAFLRARLEEDAAAAQAAHAPNWSTDGRRGLYYGVEDGWMTDALATADADHIARHDPARVLKDIEAKRLLIRTIFTYEAKIDGEWGCCHGAGAIEAGLCPETNPDGIDGLRLLALPYDDHPDYREEWRS